MRVEIRITVNILFSSFTLCVRRVDMQNPLYAFQTLTVASLDADITATRIALIQDSSTIFTSVSKTDRRTHSICHCSTTPGRWPNQCGAPTRNETDPKIETDLTRSSPRDYNSLWKLGTDLTPVSHVPHTYHGVSPGCVKSIEHRVELHRVDACFVTWLKLVTNNVGHLKPWGKNMEFQHLLVNINVLKVTTENSTEPTWSHLQNISLFSVQLLTAVQIVVSNPW